MRRWAILLFVLVVMGIVLGCGMFNPARFLQPPVAEPAEPTPTPRTIIVTVVVTPEPTEKPSLATATPVPLRTPTPVIQALGSEPAQEYLPEEKLLMDLYDRVSRSVVHIRVAQLVSSEELLPFRQRIPNLPEEFYRSGQGSGFVWDTDGHIVTNQHVVADADIVEVRFRDGTVLEAEVIGTDPQSDIAVIRVDPSEVELIPVKLGDSDRLKVGQWAIAIGNPFGQDWTMTRGIISALGRTIQGQTRYSIPEVIQTDAAINPGNSGGPLLTSAGEVIGMNTMILSQSGASAGVGFAVPVNIIKLVVPNLIETGKHAYAWLGITGRGLLPQDVREMNLPVKQGAMVIEVTPGSPAEKAKLRPANRTITIEGEQIPTGGDVITAINGSPVRNMDDLIAYLVRRAEPGQTVTLTVIREGKEQAVRVTLAERPSQ